MECGGTMALLVVSARKDGQQRRIVNVQPSGFKIETTAMYRIYSSEVV